MKHIRLDSWNEFATALKHELNVLGYAENVVVRNFELVTTEIDDQFFPQGEVDRLDLVFKTGTDRDATSPFWNVEGFDHKHDTHPQGKRGDEIIYAFTIDPAHDPYLVHHGAAPETFDVTAELTEYHGLLVYDSTMLKRVATNEYWFIAPPSQVLLFVFTLGEP
jgi:hypothetical protein